MELPLAVKWLTSWPGMCYRIKTSREHVNMYLIIAIILFSCRTLTLRRGGERPFEKYGSRTHHF